MKDTVQAAGMTIDALAQRVGMTVRNVRAHQSRGLLPAPRLQGRTGFYDDEHVVRLELIKDLQGEGFNLEAIKQILERTPGSSVAEVLGFTRAVAEPFTEEEPEIIPAEQLTGKWEEPLSADLVEKVLKLGFVRPLGDGTVEVLSPRLERAATELAEMGIGPKVAIDILAMLRKNSEYAAKAYVKLFIEHVLRPAQEADEPDWDLMRERMERLRPLASESLLAVFQIVMTEQVERALGRELERMSQQSRKKGR